MVTKADWWLAAAAWRFSRVCPGHAPSARNDIVQTAAPSIVSGKYWARTGGALCLDDTGAKFWSSVDLLAEAVAEWKNNIIWNIIHEYIYSSTISGRFNTWKQGIDSIKACLHESIRIICMRKGGGGGGMHRPQAPEKRIINFNYTSLIILLGLYTQGHYTISQAYKTLCSADCD